MRHLSYNLGILVSSLCLSLLPFSSFGSPHFTQEDKQEITRTAATTSQIAVPVSPENILPHDVRVHILSFLAEQKDLLRVGAVSRSWRKAAEKVWEKRPLDLSNKHLTDAN